MKTALVLSGGGAKGSFQLGVLQYLYKYDFRPDIITTTSVGSINGLKLAEGEGKPDQGFAGLEQIWLNMNRNSDMYDQEAWVVGLADWLKNVLGVSDTGENFFLSNKFGQFLLAAIPGVGADFLDDLKKLKEGLASHHSLFHLEPIEALARAKITGDLVQSSGIKLRMAVVALESGRLLYVTEQGRLIDDPAKPSDDSSSPEVDLVSGMLASAAIPAIFRPQWLAGEFCVDGGVREVAPLAAATALQATDVYVVVAPIPLEPTASFGPNPAVVNQFVRKVQANPFDPSQWSMTQEEADQLKIPTRGIMDLAGRSLDIVIDEILKDDIRHPPNDRIQLIRPKIEVQPSRTIDRGLIRINASYGYMTAFDVLGQYSIGLRYHLRFLTETITELRLRIWNLENHLHAFVEYWMYESLALSLSQAQSAVRKTVFEIRALKNTLRGYMDCRFECGGKHSLSPDGVYPNAWFELWEEHEPGWDEMVGPSPWAEVAWPLGIPRFTSSGGRESPGGFGGREQPGSFGAYEPPGGFGGREAPGGFGGREHPGSFGAWEPSAPPDPTLGLEPPPARAYSPLPPSAQLPAPLPDVRLFDDKPWPYYMFVEASESDAAPFSACAPGYKSSPPSGTLIESRDASKHLAVVQLGIPHHYTQDSEIWTWELVAAFWGTSSAKSGRVAQIVKRASSVSIFQSFAQGGPVALVQFDPTAFGESISELEIHKYDGTEWRKMEDISVRGRGLLNGLSCTPAIIEGMWGSRGNYEMMCCRSGKIEHYARLNDGDQQWIYVQNVPINGPSASGPTNTNVAAIVARPIAIAIFQSSFAAKLFPTGNLELFVVLTRSFPEEETYLVELSFDARTRAWTKPVPVVASNANMIVSKRAVTNVTGRPAVIQDMRTENFEMLIIRDGEVCHYRKINTSKKPSWLFRSVVHGSTHSAGHYAQIGGVPDSVAMYQSVKTKELHAVVRLRGLTAGDISIDDKLVRYRYSYSDNHWHGPTDVRTTQNMPKDVLPF
jgi:predicted acylesterase/phospholipase RssA